MLLKSVNQSKVGIFVRPQSIAHIYLCNFISGYLCIRFNFSLQIFYGRIGTIYPTPLLGQDMTQGQFLSGV